MPYASSSQKFHLSYVNRIVIFIVLCLAGLFLRVWNLDNTSLWVDEVIYAHTGQSWLESGEMKVPSGHTYSRAPLYTITTGIIYKYFGQGETQTRMTSVIFGMLSLFVAYLLAQHVFDDRLALLTMFLMVFSHFEIGWARTARMYTMFQFVSLSLIYCMIKFISPKKIYAPLNRTFIQRLNINPWWLIPLFVFFIFGYVYVHPLTVFLFFAFFVYLFIMAVIRLISFEGRERWFNKYILLTGLGMILIFTVVLVYPRSLALLQTFLKYTPPWAQGDVSALNRMILFEFLISPYRFPLALFFFIGSIQVFTRWQPKGILLFFVFMIQVVLLSFVFTHRKPVYIFNVYPLFLMLAGYGFFNILKSEFYILEEKLRKWAETSLHLYWMLPVLKTGFVLLFFSVFIFSPWLRISLHIPFSEDGISNMAVTSSEWKETAKIMRRRSNPEDIVLSTHPELSLYYGISTDYTLNWTLLNQAKSQNLIRQGQYFDNYSGVPCVENLNQLEEITAKNSNGWLLLDAYAFKKNAYLPEKIRSYITTRLQGPIVTKNETIKIYYWNRDQER